MSITAQMDDIKYPIHKIAFDEKVVDHFKDLAAHPRFDQQKGLPKGISPDTVLRYIILMYSPGTPADNMPDRSAQKTWALNFLGLKPNSPGVKALISDANEEIVGRVILFLRIQKSETFALLKVMEAVYYKTLEDIATNKDDNRQSLIKDTLPNIQKQLDAAKKTFLGKNFTVKQEQELMGFLASENLMISPQDVAAGLDKMRQTGKSPFVTEDDDE